MEDGRAEIWEEGFSLIEVEMLNQPALKTVCFSQVFHYCDQKPCKEQF